jgi:ElaB/YqjD/DUF883 family membrane-anchored ribosome-binding protein
MTTNPPMNELTAEAAEARSRLAQDLRTVIADAETLLKHAKEDAGKEYTEARARLERSMQTARQQLTGIEQAALDRVKQAGRVTDTYVHDHPWQSVGVGAAIGLLVGLLIARR